MFSHFGDFLGAGREWPISPVDSREHISSGTQEIAKLAEQKGLRRVELGGVAAISTLNSPKIGTPWTDMSPLLTHSES